MLKGDLDSTPLAPLLLQLADEPATGCLHIAAPDADADAEEALVFFKAGLVYAVSVPGRRPQLGAKLVSSGALGPEALADALEVQRTELQGWRLGELLVHLGYVDQPVVEAFVKEQVYDAVWDLFRWTDGHWRFRRNEKTREDCAPPMPVTDLLTNLRDRGAEWRAISAVVPGPTAVPMLSTRGGGAPEMTLDADAWSMLCKIDGERTVSGLARECGYTLFEAGHVLLTLVTAGLVDIAEDVEMLTGAEPSLEHASTATGDVVVDDTGADPEDSLALLARIVTEVAGGIREEAGEPAIIDLVDDAPSPVVLHPGTEQSFAESLERVSTALAEVLGPAPDTADPYEVPPELRPRRTRTPVKADPTAADIERRTRRDAAAAELAAAHALAEELRAAQANPAGDDVAVRDAKVVDLAAVRREAEEAARCEAERAAAEEAARLEAERAAAEEAARVEAERVEAERVEAERLAAEEAARLEAERAAAEEAARLEAERLAAEEAARLQAEHLAAEVDEAEQAAWSEYWQREADAMQAASDRGAAAAALLMELASDPIEPVVTPEPTPSIQQVEPTPVPIQTIPEPAEELDPEREPATVGASGMPMEMADTAALLRELSSLGMDDDPRGTPPNAPTHPPRSQQRPPGAESKKKKRGLFGR